MGRGQGRHLGGTGPINVPRLAQTPAAPRPGIDLTGHTNSVLAVAFTPDGATLATASDDGTVRLWDTTDPTRPQPLGALTSHNSSVSAVAFTPDGRTLATADYDGTVRLWDMRGLAAVRADPADAACALVRDGLDRDEWERNLPGIPYQPTC